MLAAPSSPPALRKAHSTNTDQELSPIRASTKAERYSGTPHHLKISPTKLRVAPPITVSQPECYRNRGKLVASTLVNMAGQSQIVSVKPRQVRADSQTISSKSSTTDLPQPSRNRAVGVSSLFDSNKKAFSQLSMN